LIALSGVSATEKCLGEPAVAVKAAAAQNVPDVYAPQVFPMEQVRCRNLLRSPQEPMQQIATATILGPSTEIECDDDDRRKNIIRQRKLLKL
jgi:hypothetical protein